MAENELPPSHLRGSSNSDGGVHHHSIMNPDDAPLVMAYRLGELEKKMDLALGKFDLMAQHYVNHTSLMLILDPLKTHIKELEDKDKERDQRRSNESAQFKLALTMAIFSPIMAAIVSIIVALALGK